MTSQFSVPNKEPLAMSGADIYPSPGFDISSVAARRHIVQFYENESELIASVSSHLGSGLGAGQPAVMIATKAHREAVEAQLQKNGFSLRDLEKSGRYIFLDAVETLSLITIDGVPDEGLFRAHVGKMVSKAASEGMVPRAFGEMVALLCEKGNDAGALELEQFWNRLANEHGFCLLCAYPMKSFASSADSVLFQHICERHSDVTPSEAHLPDVSLAEQRRAIATLQQKAQSLEHEIGRRMALEEVDQRLVAIIDSSDDAIISKDLNGIITSWNRGAEDIFGYTPAEAIGQPVLMLIPKGRHNEEPQILRRIRNGEKVDHYETQRQCKDGTIIDISVTISPIRDSAGTVIGASKIARDITLQKRLLEQLSALAIELTKAKDELEERVDERTASLREAVTQMEEFSYTVSHDLRAPLRAMSLYAQVLLEEYTPTPIGDPQAVQYLQRIADNSRTLDRMIQDVLTFGKVAREGVVLEPVSLDDLVKNLLRNYPLLQPDNADVVVGALGKVIGHTPSLVQVFSNLLGNAVKFVEPGTRPVVQISSELRGEKVRILIQDNGIGINPKFQHRLFGLFERLHPELSYEGNGVGLAIVRKAVLRMNGTVGVESDGHNGSCFWFELPAASE